MKPRRIVEEVLVPISIVAPPPMVITQRNCLDMCGLSKRDFLRMVSSGAFPVRSEGKLRIARYADVERYLTTDAEKRAPKHREHRRVEPSTAPAEVAPTNEDEMRAALDRVDFAAARRKGGFRAK